MEFHEILNSDILRSIGAKPPLTVSPKTNVAEIISLLRRYKKGCVIVMDGDQIAGICTERDIMTKIVEAGLPLKTPVATIMTANPKTLSITDSITKIITLMHEGGYRHVPIVEHGKLIGYISVIDVVHYLAENFPHGVFNLPPNFKQTHSAPDGA